jgi:histidinol phosphatase-like PHP family hydrolase
VYEEPQRITEAYLRAIDRYKEKIDIIAHPYAYFTEHLNMGKLAEHANSANIGLELNCCYLRNDISADKLREMLEVGDSIYVNSDAHSLSELKSSRRAGYDFLKTFAKL